MAAETVDELQHTVDAERFGKDGVDVHRGGCVLPTGRDHSHRNRAQLWVAELVLSEVGAVHDRHHEVEQNGTRTTVRSEQVESFPPVGDPDGTMTLVREQLAEALTDRLIVIYDEDESGHEGN